MPATLSPRRNGVLPHTPPAPPPPSRPRRVVNLRPAPGTPGALDGATRRDDDLVRQLAPPGADVARLLQGAIAARVAVRISPALAPRELVLIVAGGGRITLEGLTAGDRRLLAGLLRGRPGPPAGEEIRRLLKAALAAGVEVLIRSDLPPIE